MAGSGGTGAVDENAVSQALSIHTWRSGITYPVEVWHGFKAFCEFLFPVQDAKPFIGVNMRLSYNVIGRSRSIHDDIASPRPHS